MLRKPLQWWIAQLLKYSILILFAILFLAPIFWLFTLSLKSEAEFASNPLWLPKNLVWENYIVAWTAGKYRMYIPNSVIYSIAIVSGVCALSGMAGYAFAKLKFPGRDLFFNLMLLGITISFISLMIPVFYLVRDLKLLGTRWGFIIPAIAFGLPFGVLLMRAFFRGLPDELGDAARIDGCSEWNVFMRIMLPLASPGLTTLAIFQFLFAWTAFLEPLILVQRDVLRPATLGMLFFHGRYSSSLPLIAAGHIITIFPIIIVYLLLQRKFIEGITAGALK
jgi:ABC-type glycerol-3-phosphate transport system permease component